MRDKTDRLTGDLFDDALPGDVRCPECGEVECPWWAQLRAHELATRGMQLAILRQEGAVDDDDA